MTTGREETISQRVKRLRTEQGLSQRDVSSKGCSYAYISRIEAGARKPSVKALRQIAGKLGVTAFYLEHGYREMVSILTVSSLLEGPVIANVVAVLHDEQEAERLAAWLLAQGHNVGHQREPVDDPSEIEAVKKQYARVEVEQG